MWEVKTSAKPSSTSEYKIQSETAGLPDIRHRYGAEAARSAGLITGVTANIVAVYIDMRGIGRRAIVRRAGKEFVKARMSNYNRAPSGTDKCSSS